jgi:hypothetical protein
MRIYIDSYEKGKPRGRYRCFVLWPSAEGLFCLRTLMIRYSFSLLFGFSEILHKFMKTDRCDMINAHEIFQQPRRTKLQIYLLASAIKLVSRLFIIYVANELC